MQDFSHRDPATQDLLRWFDYSHLKTPQREFSQQCHDLAVNMVNDLDDSPELLAGLRKLLEAKDCFTRASLDIAQAKLMTERLIVGNVYTNNKVPGKVRAWLTANDTDVFLISELDQIYDELANDGLLLVGRQDRPRDVAIWFTNKRWRRRMRSQFVQLSPFVKRPQSDKPMLWRDRHVVRAQRGKRVWYSVHGNAVVDDEQGRWLDHAGADAWKKGMVKLKSMIEADVRMGRRVKVGGDFNQKPNRDENLNPASMFLDLGMKYVHTGVMYLAWTPKNEELISHSIRDKVPGADAHKTIHAVFKRKWKRGLRRKK